MFRTLIPVSLVLLISGCNTINSQFIKEDNDASTLSTETVAPEEENVWQQEESLLSQAEDDSMLDVFLEPEECELSELALQEKKADSSVSIWEHISKNTELHVHSKVRITMHKNWYLEHPRYFHKISKRAAPYVGYIVERLEQEDMPVDLALLPVIESAYNPFAYSHGRAAGLWQFIPMTAERFKLDNNWWYDGRRDVIASTDAAIKYLKYLHRYFDGDWLHALAAYNAGEGTLRRAIKKNAAKGYPTDFFSLKLPEETRHYVPKLLALSQLFNELSEHQLPLAEVAYGSRLAVIDTKGQIDISLLADLGGLPVETIQRLNPGFKRWATPPGNNGAVVVPLQLEQRYITQLASLPDSKRMKWVRYRVRSGDSLIKIAKKYDTKPDLIASTNNIKGAFIRVGQYLMIPVAAKSLEDYPLTDAQRLVAKQSSGKGKTRIEHVVAAGDTLWDIGKLYKVRYADLARWNSMAPGDTLKLGQKLVVWKKAQQGKSITKVKYKVRKGDSLSTISNKFNVKVADVKRWNTSRLGKYIHPGQVLILYVDINEQS